MTRLDVALQAFRDRVEASQQAQAPSRTPHTLLSPPFSADGRQVDKISQRTLVTLVTVRSVASPRQGVPPRSPGQGNLVAPRSNLEADVLVTVNDPVLHRASGRLAAVIRAIEDSPVLIPGPEPITAILVNLALDEAAHVVGLAGIRGMPFALYRLQGIAT